MGYSQSAEWDNGLLDAPDWFLNPNSLRVVIIQSVFVDLFFHVLKMEALNISVCRSS